MHSLFVYGTLGPGRPNAHIMENIGGSWQPGYVLGNRRAHFRHGVTGGQPGDLDGDLLSVLPRMGSFETA